MKLTGHDCRAFTLIELAVVIAIVCVLVCLLLPAVQAVREAARRNTCLNNLAQLVIAVQQYQNVHEVLPPGIVNTTGPIQNVPRGFHHGWLVQLLPYVEQNNIARQLNDAASLYAPENRTVRSYQIRTFLCPSDPAGGSLARGGVAQTNYAACHNDVEAPISTRNRGSIFLNSRVTYEDIPDGTAHTIFVGEKRIFALDLGWASGTRATLRNVGIPLNEPDLVFGTRPISLPDEGEGTSDGPSLMPDPTNPNLVGGFSSAHPGGANFAFGDGSVRYIAARVGARILRSLANRADGEIMNDF
jgi:prepilin-type N-terminal cleavage/methylation domain-containing protein/prepilin-type processing-associated H-X9-DG protein